MFELPEGFVELNWSAPLDLLTYRAITPPDVKLLGHFFSLVRDEVEKQGGRLSSEDKKYYAFKQYPVSEFYDLVEEALPILYPRKSTRNGLRALGKLGYTSFMETRTGRVVFGVLGRSVQSVLKAAGKGYKYTISRGRCTLLESSDKHAILQYRELYTFLDAYHMGLLEGVLEHYDCIGKIGIRRISEASADVSLMWVPKLGR